MRGYRPVRKEGKGLKRGGRGERRGSLRTVEPTKYLQSEYLSGIISVSSSRLLGPPPKNATPGVPKALVRIALTSTFGDYLGCIACSHRKLFLPGDGRMDHARKHEGFCLIFHTFFCRGNCDGKRRYDHTQSRQMGPVSNTSNVVLTHFTTVELYLSCFFVRLRPETNPIYGALMLPDIPMGHVRDLSIKDHTNLSW